MLVKGELFENTFKKFRSGSIKMLTYGQLGEAYCEVFQADSFEKIAEMSKNHAMEMFQKGDEEHI